MCHSLIDAGKKHEPAGLIIKEGLLFIAVVIARIQSFLVMFL